MQKDIEHVKNIESLSTICDQFVPGCFGGDDVQSVSRTKADFLCE